MAHLLAFWTSICLTTIGVIYILVLLVSALREGANYPPSEWLQTFGGITTLIDCILLVILMAALRECTTANRRIFGTISLSFTILFAGSVAINRFTQLGVVRQAARLMSSPGIEWFQAYGSHSVMLGLEYLGWGLFLGLGAISSALLFDSHGRQGSIRWLFLAYAILSIAGSIGFLIGNSLSLLGFAAWGPVLVAITALLTIEYAPRKMKA